MKSSKHICGNCGTEHDIKTDTELTFAICPSCQTMGEWATPEGAEAEVAEEPESTVENETEPVTDLMLIEENMSLADIWKPENVDAMIAKLEQYKTDFKGDMTTAKGRKAIISFSRKFSTSKVFVDEKGKELIEDWQTQTKAVNTQRRKFKDACDKLRDDSRKPVTDWELAEERKKHKQISTMQRLNDLYYVNSDKSVDELQRYIDECNSIVIEGDADFVEKAAKEKEITLVSLEKKLADRIQHNKDQEELAKLRAEREEREKKEASEKADQIEKDREEKIRKEAAATAKKDAAEKLAKAKAAKQKAIQEKKDAEAKAKQDKIDAEAKAKREKKEAVAAAENKAKEKADQIEKDRLANDEEKRLADEQRAANQEHREKIKTESTRFIRGILRTSTTQADAIFEAMANGEVPHISVKF